MNERASTEATGLVKRWKSQGATRVPLWAAALAIGFLATLLPGAPAGASHTGDDNTTLSSRILCSQTGNTRDNVTVFPPIAFGERFQDGYPDLAIVQYFTYNQSTGWQELGWSEWFYNNDGNAGGYVGGRDPVTRWLDFTTHQLESAWTTTYDLNRWAAARVWIWDGRLGHFVTTLAKDYVSGYNGCTPRQQYCYVAGVAGVICPI